MATRMYIRAAIFSITVTASFIISLSAISSYGQQFPATDPPTAEKIVEPIAEPKDKQIEIPPLAATTEWLYHKTADNKHPNGIEQRQLWFINRARSNPALEGIWLATESHNDVANGRTFFGVDVVKLQTEFAEISQMPPAVFDRRLYEAARIHSEDLIARDAQDHDNQFARITDAGFSWVSVGGVVFSYTRSGLHAHAAFNIDWGNEPDGMQTDRGHRKALMSDGQEYTNVGISSIYVNDIGKNVGPYVTTGNYAKANESSEDHFNDFIVGTVWSDENDNGWYDPDEGYGGVTVNPSIGTYFAVTSDSGGFAIPVTVTGPVTITFSGGALPSAMIQETILGSGSVLVDLPINFQQPIYYTVTPSAGANGSISPPTPQTIDHGNTTSFTINPDANYHINSIIGCNGTLSGNTYTTAPVVADCAVTSSFAIDTHTVSPSSGANGDISPSILQTVDHGSTASFSINPDIGYHVSNVTGTCDGTLSGNIFTTNPVIYNCTVNAIFALNTYTVIPFVEGDGSIAPPAPQTINHGSTTTFTVTPNEGFTSFVGGTCGGILDVTTYTTNTITSNCTVIANFGINMYLVDAPEGQHGTVSPYGDIYVNHGEILTFTLTPDDDYKIGEVTGCDGTLIENIYTTDDITGSCEITITFAKDNFPWTMFLPAILSAQKLY